MSDIEIHELKKANAVGRWGFSVPFIVTVAAQNADVSILSVDTPSWMARPWTITLASMVYKGGNLVGVPVGNPQSSLTFGSPKQQTSVDAKIRLDWGVDSASETAVIDYPFGGCTFQVHCANLRMYLHPTNFNGLGNQNSGRPPTLQGWVSPYARGADASDILGPTFTNSLPVLAAGVTGIYDVPARAIAYRFIPADIVSAGIAVQIQEEMGGAFVNVAQDCAGIPAGPPIYANRNLLVPLHPLCSVLQITNTDGVNSVQFSLQFLLDLG